VHASPAVCCECRSKNGIQLVLGQLIVAAECAVCSSDVSIQERTLVDIAACSFDEIVRCCAELVAVTSSGTRRS